MSNPRPPKIDVEKLSNFDMSPVESLGFFLRDCDEQRKRGEMSTPYIALEALAAFAKARVSGVPDDELKEAWLDAWGPGTIQLPASVVLTLAEAWLAYKAAPEGKTLGEAFGVEGGGQGKKPTKSRQNTRAYHKRLASEAEIEYAMAGRSGAPISLPEAFFRVAERNSEPGKEVGAETVRDAHKKFGRASRLELIRRGVLKEG